MTLLQRLNDIVGADDVSTDAQDLTVYGQDWTRFHQPDPAAVVFVREAGQLVELARMAVSEQASLVPSGGRTGLSGGACATSQEVVVSFDRMNQVVDVNSDDHSVTLQPGVVTAQLHEIARSEHLYYPVDFASSGSSQLGGNIATNAGGIRVLRYGLTRNWVSGLKVVTGTGELLDLNRGLIKNATGYDLRHLFIGSEGTLGFIVEATMQLTAPPADSVVMLLAVPEMSSCLSVLSACRRELVLNAFEFFSHSALTHVLAHAPLSAPFAEASPFYVLVEFESDEAAAIAAFEQCLEAGLATDGVISSSEQQRTDLWQYRERISESITPRTPYKNDVSVTIRDVPAFLEQVNSVVTAAYPDFEIVWFGHIGDGNLHLNILKPESWTIEDFKAACESVNETVLKVVAAFGGSVSAEHGVGLLKKPYLHLSRSSAEISMMQAVKQTFDPAGIMNPGKLL